MPRRKTINENRSLYADIGAKLRSERKKQGLTIIQVAQKMNRSRDFVLDAEVARYKIPLDKLYEYCAVLDIPLKSILPEYIPGSTTEITNKLLKI